MPPGSQWCAACQGTGKCYRCGGKGWHLCEECGGTGFLVHWMYTLAGATIVSSILNILLFLGIFYIAYIVTELRLSFNKWIYKVENMNFWFNPSFWTWLYAKHRKKWIKWGTVINLITSSLTGAFIFCIISINKITQTIFATGTLLGAAILSVFSLLFYKICTLKLESKSSSTS